jgi:hypothetical protein
MMTGGFESIESSDSSAGARVANNKFHALARLGVLAVNAYGVWPFVNKSGITRLFNVESSFAVGGLLGVE